MILPNEFKGWRNVRGSKDDLPTRYGENSWLQYHYNEVEKYNQTIKHSDNKLKISREKIGTYQCAVVQQGTQCEERGSEGGHIVNDAGQVRIAPICSKHNNAQFTEKYDLIAYNKLPIDAWYPLHPSHKCKK